MFTQTEYETATQQKKNLTLFTSTQHSKHVTMCTRCNGAVYFSVFCW